MKPTLLPFLGTFLSLIFWIVDSIIDFLVFSEGESVIHSIFFPEPVELWMRILVVFLLVTFSFYAKYVLNQQLHSQKALEKYKNELEQIVDLRTVELQSKNEALQGEIEVRKKVEKALEEIAITDPLTLLYNRRKFTELLSYEIERERRYKSGLFLIMCDIDHFKAINDNYGHGVGDEVLKTFSNIIKNSIRMSDSVARWGGEEFIVLVTNTEVDRAILIAEKLRKLVEDTKFKKVEKVTASFGVAWYEGGDTQETLIGRADKALYKAKSSGRNSVEVIN